MKRAVASITPDLDGTIALAGRYTLRVVAPSGAVIGRLVAAELREICPGCQLTLETARDGLESSDVTVQCLETGRQLVVFGQAPTAAAIAGYVEDGWSLLSIDTPEQEFRAGVRSLAEGPAFTSSDIVRVLAASARQAERPATVERLTRRELEVLGLLAEGATNREAATVLGVSPNTVRSHVQSLLTKVGATSRSKLVARARALGILA